MGPVSSVHPVPRWNEDVVPDVIGGRERTEDTPDPIRGMLTYSWELAWLPPASLLKSVNSMRSALRSPNSFSAAR